MRNNVLSVDQAAQIAGRPVARVRPAGPPFLSKRSEAPRVFVWLASHAARDNFATAVSSEDRRLAQRGYRLAVQQQQFLAGRSLLRRALTEASGRSVAPQDWVFEPDALGKLHLANNSEFEFSLSHAGDLSAVAISRGAPVGIDIESHELSNLVPPDSFLPDEPDRISSADEASRLIVLWTLKEAVAKCDGRGLSLDTRAISIDTRTNGSKSGFHLRTRGIEFGSARYQVSVAVAGTAHRPRMSWIADTGTTGFCRAPTRPIKILRQGQYYADIRRN